VRGHTVRTPACVQLVKFVPVPLTIQHVSGVYPAISNGRTKLSRGDEEPQTRIKVGKLTPFGKRLVTVSLGGRRVAASAEHNRAAGGGVSIVRQVDLAQAPYAVDAAGIYRSSERLRLDEMSISSETSVAVAGNVILYTANFPSGVDGLGAAYSTDLGTMFTRLYPTTSRRGTTAVFPLPKYATSPAANACNPYCDQVVIYDRYANQFIWVLQYASDGTTGDDVIRVANASPQALAAHGAAAWNYFDLSSLAFNGSNRYFDQPRLGLTPGFVYISFNLPVGAIVRIKHSVFRDKRFPSDKKKWLGGAAGTSATANTTVGSATFVTGSSYRVHVAQTVRGDTEYFVGLGDTGSSLAVASVRDGSDTLEETIVPTWPRAYNPNAGVPADWTSITPSGGNWLLRVASTPINLGVTMGGDGSIWAAWSEGRNVYDSSGNPVDVNGKPLAGTFSTTYSQPHIGVVQLRPFRDRLVISGTPSSPFPSTVSGFDLRVGYELVNQNYALTMPDLATTADGEVAMGFSAGGGPGLSSSGAIDMVHGVGFLTGTRAFVTDARSDTLTTDSAVGPPPGNFYGDYNAVRALPAPYGNCLVASSVVTQKLVAPGIALTENHPLVTFFSRPGAKCPKPPAVRPPRPPTPPPPPPKKPTPTQLLLTCPRTATTGTSVTVNGQLTPAQLGQTIAVTISGGSGGGGQSVSTAADGTFRASFDPGSAGTYSVTAQYVGNAGYLASSAACSIAVSAARGTSSLALNCPETASPNEGLTVTAQLTPPLQGADVDMSATGPGIVPSQTVRTDVTGLAYYSFTIGSAGAWTITASWAGDAAHRGSSTTCSIAVQDPSTLTIACPANLLLPTAAASISGTLLPSSNGSAVTITYTPPAGSGVAPTVDHVTTDSTGYFADTFGENASGTWTATAAFGSDATRAPSTASCTFTVLSS
jgi:hypothetical protein